MFTVYILPSEKTDKYYTGYTKNLRERVQDHNSGKNISTKHGVPWKLVYSELLATKTDAWKREHQIKSYRGGEAFKKLLD